MKTRSIAPTPTARSHAPRGGKAFPLWVATTLAWTLVSCGGAADDDSDDVADSAHADAPANGDAAVNPDGADAVVSDGDSVGAGAMDSAGDAPSATDTKVPAFSTATSPSQLVFSKPTPWSQPIASHLKRAGATSDTRLYGLFGTPAGALLLAYGTASGVGSGVPVDFRAIGNAGEAIVDAKSHDSALRRFRRFGDALWAPGGHPTDGNKGNLYRFPSGGPWQRYESVPLAEQLHDVYVDGQVVWLAGIARPNADQPKDYRYAALWKSDDGGNFFEIMWQSPNAQGGVAVLGHLFSVGGAIVALGEKTDNSGNIVELPHVTFDGKAVLPLGPTHALKSLRPLASGVAVDGSALLGADDVLAPGDPVLLQLDKNGVIALDPAGHRLVALFADAAGGETLLLEEAPNGHARVRALRKDGTTVDLLSSSALPGGVRATCVGYRPGQLILGTSSGDLLLTSASWRTTGLDP